jgi:hypothetical protein
VAKSAADTNEPSRNPAPGEKPKKAANTPPAAKPSSKPVPHEEPVSAKTSVAAKNAAQDGPDEAPAAPKKSAPKVDAGAEPNAAATTDKTPGEKSPADSQPAAPPVDKPRRISKSVDLPAFRPSAPDLIKPFEVMTWSEPPKQTKLILHGLDSANQRLQDKSASPKSSPRLTLEADDTGAWTIGVQLHSPRQQAEAVKDLARLSQTAGSLAFQWLDADRSPETAAARAWLRTCVLEFERDGSKEFLLLCPPVKLAEKHFINGVAEFRSDEFKAKAPAELPAQYFNGIDFRLAYCTVQLTDDQQLMLIEGIQPADPVAADVLTSRAGIGGVRVILQRSDKNTETWQISLEIDAPTSLLDLRRRQDGQEDELAALRTQLAAHGKSGATLDQKQAAVRALADILKIVAPMNASADEDDATARDRSRKDFDNAVEKQVLDPARRRHDELGKSLPRSKVDLKQAEADFNRRAAEFRAHAASVSAVLYRVVDDKILADCLILGDPGEPPSDEGEETEGP